MITPCCSAAERRERARSSNSVTSPRRELVSRDCAFTPNQQLLLLLLLGIGLFEMRLASPEMYARVRGAAVRGGVKKRSQGGQISVLSVDQIRHL